MKWCNLLLFQRIALPLLVTMGAGYAWWATANMAGGHLLQAKCQTCHLGAGPIKASNASTLIGRQEDLCATCHPDAVRASHPSGFAPRHPLPRLYKLDWKGELTCSTCHTVHGSTPGLMKSPNHGKAFCQECHDQKFFDKMADQGQSMTISGHLDAKGSGDQAIPPPLDAFSIQCMGCHGEMDGSNLVRIEGDGFLRHSGNPLSHPIGGQYESPLRGDGLHPRVSLPPEIMLPNGQMSCLSCHQGYSKKHGGLVMSNDRSSLCLKCHDM